MASAAMVRAIRDRGFVTALGGTGLKRVETSERWFMYSPIDFSMPDCLANGFLACLASLPGNGSESKTRPIRLRFVGVSSSSIQSKSLVEGVGGLGNQFAGRPGIEMTVWVSQGTARSKAGVENSGESLWEAPSAAESIQEYEVQTFPLKS